MNITQQASSKLPLGLALRNALAKSGGAWQVTKRADRANHADYDEITIGAYVVRRYEDRIVAINGGMATYAGMEFTALWKQIANYAAQTPKVDSLDALRAIEPFTVVQAALALDVTPAHARIMISAAVASKRLGVYPVEFGPPRWYVVGKSQKPAARANRDDLRRYERRPRSWARWCAALERETRIAALNALHSEHTAAVADLRPCPF